MKAIKSNRYQNAVSEIEALDADQIVMIPETIDEVEKNLYHVGMVRIFDKPGQPKNDVRVDVQKFHTGAFAKLEKRFVYQGITKLVIIHDPSLNVNEEIPTPTATTTNAPAPGMSEAEIEAEIEKRAQAKANQMIANQTGSGTPEAPKTENVQNDAKIEEKENKDLSVMFGTIAEMREFAEKNGVDLSGLKKADEIKATLMTWYNENRVDKTQE